MSRPRGRYHIGCRKPPTGRTSGTVLGVELGYARVSTAKQGPRPQVDALTTAGIPAKRIYLDKKSGATTERPGLRVLLDYARPGADFTDASDDADRVPAVCDDVIVSHEGDGDLAVFDREAATFAAAVGSALADLERSLPAARVLRVEAVPVAGELSVAAVS